MHLKIPPGSKRIDRSSIPKGKYTSIAIPSSVGEIGENAFCRLTLLVTVTIPDSVTKIGRCAFAGCTVLVGVIIPNSVTHIRDRAFSGCTSLTSVIISNLVTIIEQETFYKCLALRDVIIPNSVKTIGYCAFTGCIALENVTISNSVTHIENKAFMRCKSITSLVIPSSVVNIGREAFFECEALKHLTIPDSVEYIGTCAFSNCVGLLTATISYSVIMLDTCAFSHCTSLESVTFASLDAHTPDEPVRGCVIGDYAFGECDSLTYILIPDSVIKINENAIKFNNSLRIIDYGRVATLDMPNRFLTLNWVARTATFEHQLGNGDSCVALHNWPPSNDEVYKFDKTYDMEFSPMYAATESNTLDEVVDVSGILSPIPLQDLSGNEYPVYGCWNADCPTPDFKALAAAQYPEELGNISEWTIMLPNAETTIDTLYLPGVPVMLARGDVTLTEPWLLVWVDIDTRDDSEDIIIEESWWGVTG